MNVNPADRGKVVVLVVAVVLVFGAIVWQLRPAPSAASAPVAETVPIAGSDKPETTVAANDSKEQVLDLPELSAAPDANPFRVVLQTPEAKGTAAPAVRTNQSAAPPRPRGDFRMDGGAKPFLPPIDGVDGAPSGPQSLGLRLDGIIAGSPSVAVIHFGEESLVLHVGQQFGDGLRVISISDSRVVVGKGKERITLMVGDTSH